MAWKTTSDAPELADNHNIHKKSKYFMHPNMLEEFLKQTILLPNSFKNEIDIDTTDLSEVGIFLWTKAPLGLTCVSVLVGQYLKKSK